jgi:sulfatase maturation enzyme AslB (radical SAM superfamily)
MTPEDLKLKLGKKYKLVCYKDLADVNQQHSLIYKIFQEYHKDEFMSDERIVFYSSHRPSDRLLKHIQNAANLIDISSCFVMICGPFDLNEKLKTLSHDSASIEYYSTDIDSKFLTDDQLYIEDSVCPLPWMHLAVMNLGQCKACCVSKLDVGSVTDSSMNQLFYSETMNSLRTAMLTGHKPSECSHCWDLENQNITSNRQWHLGIYRKQLYTEWLDSPSIRSIDFRPSNICNFKCRICTPEASSLITSERLTTAIDSIEIVKLKNINAQGRWFDNDTKFIDQILDLLPSLINIDFYGGEPFLLKQLPTFLEKAIILGCAKHIRLHFNTNGSIFPETLLDYFKHFKQVDISISVDNVGKRFEIERGGSWQLVEENIKKFNAQPNLHISIMPTVNIQNVLYLDDITQWADNTKNQIIFNYLDFPSYLNIKNLTPTARKLVINKYQHHSHPELKKIAKRVQNSGTSDGIKFVEYMKQLDQHRGQRFLESHYEIALAMGYCV